MVDGSLGGIRIGFLQRVIAKEQANHVETGKQPIEQRGITPFADQVRRLIAESRTPVREVLVPTQQINQLDSTGADQLIKLQAELAAKGIAMSFAEVKAALRDAIRRNGLEEIIGEDRFYESIEDGVQAFLNRHEAQ